MDSKYEKSDYNTTPPPHQVIHHNHSHAPTCPMYNHNHKNGNSSFLKSPTLSACLNGVCNLGTKTLEVLPARAQKFVHDGTQCGTQYYNTLQKQLSTNYEKLQGTEGYRSLRQFLKDRPLVSFVSATVLLFTFFPLITFLSFVLGSFCFTLFGFIMIEGTLLSIATIIAFSSITILAWIGLLVAVGLLLAYTVTSRIVHFFRGTLIPRGKERANSAYCFFRSHIPKTLFLDDTGSNGISACKCCQAGTNAESMCHTCTKTLNNSHQRVVGLVESNHSPYHYGPRNAKDSDDDNAKPIDMASHSNTFNHNNSTNSNTYFRRNITSSNNTYNGRTAPSNHYYTSSPTNSVITSVKTEKSSRETNTGLPPTLGDSTTNF